MKKNEYKVSVPDIFRSYPSEFAQSDQENDEMNSAMRHAVSAIAALHYSQLCRGLRYRAVTFLTTIALLLPLATVGESDATVQSPSLFGLSDISAAEEVSPALREILEMPAPATSAPIAKKSSRQSSRSKQAVPTKSSVQDSSSGGAANKNLPVLRPAKSPTDDSLVLRSAQRKKGNMSSISDRKATPALDSSVPPPMRPEEHSATKNIASRFNTKLKDQKDNGDLAGISSVYDLEEKTVAAMPGMEPDDAQKAEPVLTGRETEALNSTQFRKRLMAQAQARAGQEMNSRMQSTMTNLLTHTLSLHPEEPLRIDTDLGYDIYNGWQGGLELVIPIWGGMEQGSAWFIQPGYHIWQGIDEDDRHDMNIGLVFRSAMSDDMAWGTSLFYDHNLNEHHHRMGLGFDVQGTHTLGSLNFYLPLHWDWKTTGRLRTERETIRIEERLLRGGDVRLSHRITDELELEGSVSLWDDFADNSGRHKGWKFGGSVGGSYELYRGLSLEGKYEWLESLDGNRYQVGLNYRWPSLSSVSDGGSVDLFRAVERERRLLYARREVSETRGDPNCFIRITHNVQGQVVVPGTQVEFIARMQAQDGSEPIGGRCVDIPSPLVLRNPIELQFNAGDDTVYAGEELVARAFWRVPTVAENEALPEAQRVEYSSAENSYIFNFRDPAGGFPETRILSTSAIDGNAPPVALASDERPATVSLVSIESQSSAARDVIEVDEGAGAVRLTVRVTRSAGDVREIGGRLLPVVLAGNQARPGEDFVAQPVSFVIPAGQDTTVVSIPVIADNQVEGDESFSVMIELNERADDATAGTRMVVRSRPVTVLIRDDDVAATNTRISFVADSRNLTVAENAGTVALTIQVERAAGVGMIRGQLLPEAGTARADEDFPATPIRFTIPTNANRVTLSLPIIDDAITEPRETLRVAIRVDEPATGVSIGASASVTIVDDDIGVTNPATRLFFTPATAATTVLEGDSARLQLQLSSSQTVAVSGQLRLSAGSATLGADVPAAAIPFTIAAGQTTVTATIATIDDTVAEDIEQFSVSIQLDNPALRIATGADAVVRILDNERAASLLEFAPDSRAISVDEGGTLRVNLSLRRTLALTSAVTGTIQATAGSATATEDFRTTPTAFTIPAGANSVAVELPILIDDDVVEASERFTLVLATTTANVMTGAPATVTIVDNDAVAGTPPRLSFAAASRTVTVAENAAAVTLSLQLATAWTETISGSVQARSGTAIAGVDVSNAAVAFTLPAGMTTVTVSLPLLDDTEVEGDETFRVRIQADDANGVTVPVGSDAVVTITDVENVVRVQAEVVSVGGVMQNSEATGVSVQVQVAEVSTAPITGSLRVILASASASVADFVNRNGVIADIPFSIPAGNRSQTVMVPLTNDRLFEGNENFRLRFVNLAAGVVAAADLVVTIRDDEVTALTVADVSVTEGDTFTVVITATPAPAEQVTGMVTLTAGSGVNGAMPNTDYTVPANLAFTIPVGQSSARVMISTVEDTVAEGNETFSFTIAATAPSGGARVELRDPQATLTIIDDDVPMVTGTVLAAAEGGNIQVQLAASRAGHSGVIRGTLTPVFTTTANSAAAADLGNGAAPVTFTIPARTATNPGNRTTVTLPVTDDTLVEGAESLALRIAITEPTTGYSPGANIPVSITDNDPVRVVVTAAPVSVSEADSTATRRTTLTATATWAYDTVDGTQLQGNFVLTDDTATAGADYVVPANRNFTMTYTTAGGVTTTTTAEVVINDDTLLEGTETFRANASVNTPSGAIIGPAAVITIRDDEIPMVPLSARVVSAMEEDGAAIIEISFTRAADDPTTVTGTLTASAETGDTATAGADFSTTPVNFSLTGGANPANRVSTVQVRIPLIDDNLIDPNETFTITMTGVTRGYTPVSPFKVTIEDNELASLVVTAAPAMVMEGANTTLTATATWATGVAANTEITGNFVLTAGTATTPADYTVPGDLSFTLTRVAGEPTATATVMVATVDDADVEGNHQFTANATASSTAGDVIIGTAATITIVDNDQPQVFGTMTTVVEGGVTGVQMLTVRAVRGTNTAAISGTLTPVFATAGVGNASAADLTSGTAAIDFTIPMNQTEVSLRLPIADDNLVEGPETFALSIAVASPTAVYTAGANIPVTITDDELASLAVTAAPAPVAEGATTTLTATATWAPGVAADTAITGNFVLTPGTATATADYTVPGDLSFTIRRVAGQPTATATLAVATVDDREIEGDHQFTANATASSTAGNVLIGDAVTIVITDNDVPTVFGTATTVREGASDTLTLQVARGTNNAAVSGTLTPVFTTAGTGNASAADLTNGAAAINFTIPMGAAQTTVNLPLVDDDLVEGTETFALAIAVSSPTSVYTAGANIPVTITDNEVASLAVTAAPAPVGEGATTTLTATATWAPGVAVDTEITGNFVLTPGTATATADYTVPGDLSFTIRRVAGQPTATATLAVATVDDREIEGDHQFTANATASSTAGNVIIGDAVTIVITDNDVPTVFGTATTVREGASDTLTLQVARGTNNAAVSGTLTPVFTTTGSGNASAADLTGGAGAINFTIPMGAAQTTVNLPLVDDDLVEGTETFALAIAVASPTGVYTAGANIPVTITDNEVASLVVTAAPMSVGEGASTTLTATATWASGVAAGTTITGQFVLTPGSATTPADYTVPTNRSFTLTRMAGEATASATLTVATVTDTITEGDHQFTANATASSTAGNVIIGSAVTITIVELPRVTVTEQFFADSGIWQLRLNLSSSVSSDISIPYTIGGSANEGVHFDRLTVANPLVISAGSTTEVIRFQTYPVMVATGNLTVNLGTITPANTVVPPATTSFTRMIPQVAGAVRLTRVGEDSAIFFGDATVDRFSVTISPFYANSGCSRITFNSLGSSASVFGLTPGCIYNVDILVTTTGGDMVRQPTFVIRTLPRARNPRDIALIEQPDIPDGLQSFIYRQSLALVNAGTLPMGGVTYTLRVNDAAARTAGRTVTLRQNSVTFTSTLAEVAMQITANPNTNLTAPVDFTLITTDTGGAEKSFTITLDQSANLQPGADQSILEQDAGDRMTVTVPVTLDRAVANPVVVNWATRAGTATAGADFITNFGQLTFAPGETSKQVTVTLLGDTQQEAASENFTVRFTPVAVRGLLTTAAVSTTITILDNDLPDPDAGFQSTTISGAENTTLNAVVALSASRVANDMDNLPQFNYTVTSGTAVAGEDFTIDGATAATINVSGNMVAVLRGSVTIPLNSSTVNIPIMLLPDTAAEGDEMFTITLNSATNANLISASSTATATITNVNFPLPTLSIDIRSPRQVNFRLIATQFAGQTIEVFFLSTAETTPVAETDQWRCAAGGNTQDGNGMLVSGIDELCFRVTVPMSGATIQTVSGFTPNQAYRAWARTPLGLRTEFIDVPAN